MWNDSSTSCQACCSFQHHLEDTNTAESVSEAVSIIIYSENLCYPWASTLKRSLKDHRLLVVEVVNGAAIVL